MEPLNAHIESQHSETDLTINTFNHLSPAQLNRFLAMKQKKKPHNLNVEYIENLKEIKRRDSLKQN
jgi:hypothetical protein